MAFTSPLHVDVKYVDELLAACASVNAVDSVRCSCCVPLCACVLTPEQRRVSLSLCVAQLGMLPLHRCCLSGNVDGVVRLLAIPALDVNVVDEVRVYGCPLPFAAPRAALLVPRRCDVTPITTDRCAAGRGDNGDGLTVDERDPPSCSLPAAPHCGLLRASADARVRHPARPQHLPTGPQQYGDVALHYACVNGHGKIATLLLQHGARLDVAGEDGLTPLDAALEGGHFAVVDTLRLYVPVDL